MSIEKSTTILLTVFLASLPSLFIPGIHNGYEYPRFILFTVGSLVFFVAFIFFVFIKNIQLTFHKVHFVLLLLIAFIFFTDITGIDPAVSLFGSSYRYQGFITLLSGSLLFFTVSFWDRIFPQVRLYIMRGLITSACIISVVAFYQFFSLHFLGDSAFPRFDDRIVATFGNPNFLGGYLVIMFTFIYLQNTKFSSIKLHINPKLRNIMIGIIIIGMVSSLSRSALILLPIIFISPFMFSKVKNPKKLIGLFLFSMFFISSIFFLRSSVYDTRMLIWKEGIRAVVNNPIFGYGQENFELIFPLDRFMKVDSAHNIFLEFAVAGGLVSFGLFLWFLYLILKKSPFDIKLMLLAFLITASFNPVSIAQWSLFWVFAGFSASKA